MFETTSENSELVGTCPRCHNQVLKGDNYTMVDGAPVHSRHFGWDN